MNQDLAYCFNPYCSQPENVNYHQQCQNCGFLLLIAERYQAHKLIASGRFGRTFFGEDIKHHHPCMIKQFFPESEQGILLNSEKAIQLFHSEARRLEELGDHPQIPQLYAHLEQETYQYLIQEWIQGDNLETKLSQRGRFDERDIRRLLASLLPVLNYLRNAGVIHRDIKPENIIHRDTTDPEYVLVDFGAAKLASLSHLAKTGTIIGSPGYAAPEQVYGQPSFASDIYSLGVTCLHLLTGVSPFDLYHPTESKLLWRYYCEDDPISDSLAAILNGMTAFDLQNRYSSPEEVLSALGVLSHLPASSSANSSYPSENPSIVKLASGKGAIYAVDFSPDGIFLASGGGSEWGKLVGKDNCVRLWRVGQWQHHQKLNQHSAPITTVQFSQDGEFLASGGLDKTIKVWNFARQQLHQTFKGHRFGVSHLQVSPYEDTVLSGSTGGEIILWHLHTGRVLNRLSWHLGEVKALAMSPDGDYFAVAGGETSIQLWEVQTFKPLFSLTGHSDIVHSLDFSPNGRYLASGSGDWDCSIRVWDLATRTVKQTLQGHQWAVNAVKFSPDGRYLASGSSDKTVRLAILFQRNSHQYCWSRHHEAITTVAFSPNGDCLASGSEDETIRIYGFEELDARKRVPTSFKK